MGNTRDEIRDRMLALIPSDLDSSEGSFIRDSLVPTAIELELVYTRADEVLTLGFAETTTVSQYLDYRCHEHGVYRKAAVKAAGQVTVTGTPGTVIPLGTLFATASWVQFATLAEVTTGEGGTIIADVEAVTAGTAGNVPSAAINSIPVSITGVTAVTNINPTAGGTDTETDAALLDRLLGKVQQPATSGNAGHYRQWALEVAGIGDARVQPIWNGAGTIRIIVIGSNKLPVTADKVTEVCTYIDTMRPIGAAVTVISAAGLTINVTADVTLAAGHTIEEITTAVEAAITAHLAEIAFQQNYVSYAKIGSILLDIPGILDYTNLSLNSGTANVSVADTEAAVMGTVTLV